MAHHRRDRVQTADQQQRRDADRLVKRDRPSIHFRRRDLADQVVAGIGRAFSDVLAGIFEEQRQLLLLRRIRRDLRISERQQRQPVFFGQVDHAHEDLDRQMLREIGDELAAALGLERFDQLDRERPRLPLPLLERGHGEGGREQAAKGLLLGRIELDRGELWIAGGRHLVHRCALARCEAAIIGERLGQMIAAGQDPVPPIVWRPKDVRRLLLQVGISRVVEGRVPHRPIAVEIDHEIGGDVVRNPPGGCPAGLRRGGLIWLHAAGGAQRLGWGQVAEDVRPISSDA